MGRSAWWVTITDGIPDVAFYRVDGDRGDGAVGWNMPCAWVWAVAVVGGKRGRATPATPHTPGLAG